MVLAALALPWVGIAIWMLLRGDTFSAAVAALLAIGIYSLAWTRVIVTTTHVSFWSFFIRQWHLPLLGAKIVWDDQAALGVEPALVILSGERRRSISFRAFGEDKLRNLIPKLLHGGAYQ
tara:strand:- start:273 stop:632 length:360 start_codon:yes stop_codon:yes gene_type:complete